MQNVTRLVIVGIMLSLVIGCGGKPEPPPVSGKTATVTQKKGSDKKLSVPTEIEPAK